MTKFRFPVTGDKAGVSEILGQSPTLIDDTDNYWSWVKTDESNTVLGRLRLDEDHLVLETNSVERGERGVDLVLSLLGDDLVGQPIGVHENIENLMASMPATGSSPSSEELQQMPEVQALLQKAMKDHYLKTLDEPIPMLDNDSPRACATDPGKHDKVVGWLKHLENTEAKSPGPAQDFTWLWDELDLGQYRQVETE